MTSDEAATLYDEARTLYHDNRDWLSTRSVTKARLFQDACIALMEAKPSLSMTTAAGGQHQVMLDTKLVQAMFNTVSRWLDANDSTALSQQPHATQLVPQMVRG